VKLPDAIRFVLDACTEQQKPLAVVLAGHNGSGKSTLWYERLAPAFQMPLINADRMMVSILPPGDPLAWSPWAKELRDKNDQWMRVAQRGVQAFVAEAMAARLPIATETVFSHWHMDTMGRIESKISLIRQLQSAGYFVSLIFVGLRSVDISIERVGTRVAEGGHAVSEDKLRARFPRTQKAIREAALVADATLMVDNSRAEDKAFTLCRAQLGRRELYDLRRESPRVPVPVRAWMDVVSPG